ncbi:chemerin-like receptor 1 [Mantella aurantiaca]
MAALDPGAPLMRKEKTVKISQTEKEILSENLCFNFWDARNQTATSKFKYLSTEVSQAVIALATITCLTGLTTNSIVIYLTGFKMKKQKSRLWFLNLAVADLLFLLTTPTRLTMLLSKNWTLGSLICKLSHFAYVCNMYSSAFLITALSVDRVLSVAKPLWHHKIFSQRICFCICTAIWLAALPLGTPAIYYNDVDMVGNERKCAFIPFLYDNSKNDSAAEKILYVSFAYKAMRITSQENETWEPAGFVRFPQRRSECKGSLCCADDISVALYKKGRDFSNVSFIPVITIGYFIPICVMIFTNLIIVLQVRRSHCVNSRKLYKFVAVLVGAFLLTKTPFAVAKIIYLKAINNMDISFMKHMRGVRIVLFVIANVSSCLNPVLYVLIGSKARDLLTSSVYSTRSRLSSNFKRSNKSVTSEVNAK